MLSQHKRIENIISFMMYKPVNGLLTDRMNYILTMIKYIIILQHNVTFIMLIKDVSMFTQDALVI